MFEEGIAHDNSFDKELVEHLDSVSVLSSMCNDLEVYAEKELLCNHSLTHKIGKEIFFFLDAFHYDLAHCLHDTLRNADLAVCLDVARPIIVKEIEQDQVDFGCDALLHDML